MPRYYCDYCDTYLTHDSPSVRKQHNAGYKRKTNVRSYYQQFEEQQTQSLIDQRIKEHLGQAAAFQQVGATFNQHLMSLPGNPQRPRLPVLAIPILPIGATSQAPVTPLPGVRPPILPCPVVGYGVAPNVLAVPPTGVPPGTTSMPMQMNNLPRPPTLPPSASGAATTPNSDGAAPPLINPALYQANPSSASFTPPGAPARPPGATALQDGFSYAPTSETSH